MILKHWREPDKTIKHENYSFEQIRKEVLWILKHPYQYGGNGCSTNKTFEEQVKDNYLLEPLFNDIKDWFDNKLVFTNWNDEIYNENWQ